MVSFEATLENALQIAKNVSGDEIPKAVAFAVKAYVAKEFLFTAVFLGCMAYTVYRLIYCLTRSGGE